MIIPWLTTAVIILTSAIVSILIGIEHWWQAATIISTTGFLTELACEYYTRKPS